LGDCRIHYGVFRKIIWARLFRYDSILRTLTIRTLFKSIIRACSSPIGRIQRNPAEVMADAGNVRAECDVVGTHGHYRMS
jgi:hypothetical protein